MTCEPGTNPGSQMFVSASASAPSMILNERILRVILTLAEDLHFGRAAARLRPDTWPGAKGAPRRSRAVGTRSTLRTVVVRRVPAGMPGPRNTRGTASVDS